jgi:hypothetical protein
VRGEMGNLGIVDDAAKRLHDAVDVLRDRAARVEAGVRESAAGLEESLRQRVVAVESGVPRRVAAGRTTGARQPDLAAVEKSVRRVIRLIEENPVPAALVALGVGVIATSMWSERNAGRPARSGGAVSDRED